MRSFLNAWKTRTHVSEANIFNESWVDLRLGQDFLQESIDDVV